MKNAFSSVVVVFTLIFVLYGGRSVVSSFVEVAKVQAYGLFAMKPLGSVPNMVGSSNQIDVNAPFALPQIEIFSSVASDTHIFGPAIADLDGDGNPELIYSRPSSSNGWYQYVAKATGVGYETVYSCSYNGNSGIYTGSCAYTGSGSAPTLSSGSRKVAPLAYPWGGQSVESVRSDRLYYALPGLAILGGSYEYYNSGEHFSPLFADINGDGLSDMVYSAPTRGGFEQVVAFGTGDGFEFANTCRKEVRQMYSQQWGYYYPAFYAGDCANDGSSLPRLSGSSVTLQPLGFGGTNRSSAVQNENVIDYALPEVHMTGGGFVDYHNAYSVWNSPLFVDVNYDGRLDMMYSNSSTAHANLGGVNWKQGVWINTGSGFENVYACSKNDARTRTSQGTTSVISYTGDCAQP